MPRTVVDLADPDPYHRGIPHDTSAPIPATPELFWNPIDEFLDRDLRIDAVGEPESVRSNFANGIERPDVVVR